MRLFIYFLSLFFLKKSTIHYTELDGRPLSHGSRCQKCSGPHKLEHHRNMAWCCKANPKINPSRLETKPDEPHPHTFKCINCKGEHMANNTKWPFWKHHFNCEWHIRKAQEAQEIRANSTCLAIGGKNL